MHQRSRSACGHHRNYRLTCDQYDALYARSEGRCEICRKPHTENRWYQKPDIDHDPFVGNWAVRGLLCSGCNTSIPNRDHRPEVIAYLANPWYPVVLAELGLSYAGRPDEPEHGVVVRDWLDRRWVSSSRRQRIRTWSSSQAHGGSRRSVSWVELNVQYGPIAVPPDVVGVAP